MVCISQLEAGHFVARYLEALWCGTTWRGALQLEADISSRLAPQPFLDPPEAEDAEMDGEGGEHPRGGHPRPDGVAVLLET